MPLDVVVGTQWGDEGKGRIVDLLAAQADVVARYNGGDNAGHTVTAGGQIYQLHLIPSGIIHSRVRCLLGAGMVINPARLLAEIDDLTARGLDVSPGRLRLSCAAHILTPAHIARDGAEEGLHPGEGLGTTRRGIGPAYTDKAARRGLRAGAMRDPAAFGREVEARTEAAAQGLVQSRAQPVPDPADVASVFAGYAERLRPYLADVGAVIRQSLAAEETVLAEGAQGTLLDLDHGTYPFVTSSHPTVPGALQSLGVGPGQLRRIVGVTKAFQTRVGSGPFPTELHGAAAERLRGTGANPWDEFGTTTGRARRCGWLDGALLAHAARLNGLTELAVTKLDILSGVDPVPIATGYRAGLPEDLSDLAQAAPIYADLPGWTEDLRTCRRWEALPQAARGYVERLEALAGVPVRLISVGPERDQVIDRQVPA